MIQVFVDREWEIESLEREYERNRASFVIIYGRRRVGKTELVKRFLEGKKGVYYLADRRGYLENIRSFQQAIELRIGIRDFSRISYQNWIEVFQRIAEEFPNERIAIVIDEFPYLVEKGVLSEFQKAWDLYLSNTNIFLILVGSSVSMMHRLTMDYSSPLYGRRTMQLKIEKMKFWDAWKFLPNYTLEEFLKIYGAVDGIPYYLIQMDRKKSAERNIKDEIFRKERILYEEAEILLRMEFREFQRYFSILSAISSGKRRFSEIASQTNMDSGTLSRYLNILEECELVKEDEPLMGKRKMRRYRLADNYFTFWFRFVYPNRNMLEIGYVEEVWNTVKKDFLTYLGYVFEDVILSLIQNIYPNMKVGKWWDRQGNEVDMLAVDDRNKKAICGEVKLGRITEKDMDKLKEKAEKISGLEGYEINYMLIGKNIDVDEKGVEIWNLRDVEKMMRRR